jgi:N-succinyldiaminopimelate aminotransferase
MTTTRVLKLAGIGVDKMGVIADRLQNERLLRLENLDTDLAPPAGVVETTKREVELDSANSYLPFFGFNELREAATAPASLMIS